jgi:DNA ligase-1
LNDCPSCYVLTCVFYFNSYISTEETPSFWFEPCEVWEIRGADLTLSPVHHAAEGLVVDELYSSSKTRGIALRFPRFIRVRTDKSTEDATTDQDVHSLFLAQSQRIKPD